MKQITIASGNERLLKLADLLERDAENPKGAKFDLGFWGEVDEMEENKKPRTIKIECGTTACAVGLACLSGAFKKEGLTYKIGAKNSMGGNNFLPKFGSHTGVGAVEAFFHLHDWGNFTNLFSEYAYDYRERKGAAGERAVAERIREFVAKRKP